MAPGPPPPTAAGGGGRQHHRIRFDRRRRYGSYSGVLPPQPLLLLLLLLGLCSAAAVTRRRGLVEGEYSGPPDAVTTEPGYAALKQYLPPAPPAAKAGAYDCIDQMNHAYGWT